MTGEATDRRPVPDAHWPVDVYKSRRLAAQMWREATTVVFQYADAYVDVAGPPVAFTLPVSRGRLETAGMRVPVFFAGLLPEGETRRRDIQRAFHLAEDDELGLLAIVGADTVGDVQVVSSGERLPEDDGADVVPAWSSVSFAELWRQLPGPRTRSALPGVQPKMSAQSRSLHGGAVGPVIVKFPIDGWHGVLSNEQFFMSRAPDVGLTAPRTAIVTDAEGQPALEVARFDRSRGPRGTLERHAQEDASQVLGLRPGQKYDPDARTVVRALASPCASPKLAARDLFHQLVYSYAIGNNDVHSKNLSIHQGPSGLWTVTPVYDVLHTWPYEGDHRFIPALRPDGPHKTVTLRWWLAFAADIDLPERAARRVIDRVVAAIPALIDAAEEAIDLPGSQMRDLTRIIRRRARDLEGS